MTAGQLDLTGAAGSWTATNTAAGIIDQPVADIGAYQVVPGDELTFTQTIDVVLSGDNIAAEVTMNADAVTDNFDAGSVSVSPVTLSTASATLAGSTLTSSHQDITASATFSFSDAVVNGTTMGNAGSGDTYNFNNVSFVLTQVTPAL